jgi:multidrug efflux pump subunit AcrA (membrane-fusion protein)
MRFISLALLFAATPALAAQYDCLMEPKQELKLAAPVQGVVSEVNVDRGDIVHKGQVLARLESDVEEATAQIAAVHAANETAIASGRARVEFLQRKMNRNEQLRPGNIVSFAVADEAAADEKVAEAQLREAEMNVAQARVEAHRAIGLLKQRLVISPVDGVVTERARCMATSRWETPPLSCRSSRSADTTRQPSLLWIAFWMRRAARWVCGLSYRTRT